MPRGNLQTRIPADRVEAHYLALVEKFPTLARTHFAHLAGVAPSVMNKVPRYGSVRLITPDTEERLLAVTERHVSLMPPYHVPREPVIAHIDRLLTIEGVSRNSIAKLAGLSYQTLYNIKTGVSETVQYRTHAAIMAVTEDMARENAPRRDPRKTATMIRALEANGWPLSALTDMLGCDARDVFTRTEYVLASIEARVRDLYVRLEDTPGPDRRAARYAQGLGYRTPIHYDDDMMLVTGEDGPDEQLDARFRLCVLMHVIGGWGDQAIAEKYGVSAKSVEKIRQRAKLTIERATVLSPRRVADGQEALVATIREAAEGIAWREAIECLDDDGIDYVARWEAVQPVEEADTAAA